jgi:Organic solute transporter Ostalpha
LGIKRGILQYVWLKPALSLVTIVMKLNGTFESNKISLTSGYMWIGIIYNVSISVSLYCLALFWYCLIDDLSPYRAVPKFLCIKAVIFFSYWQGFLLSVLVFAGVIPDSGTSTIARAIQNSLLCVEMLGFAIAHWIAFSYQDYATSALIGFSRLPFYMALRDTFGIVDLIVDFQSTFYGSNYGYRQFDSVQTMLDHPESSSRRARINAGLRYQNGGRSKYWLPRSTLKSASYEREQLLHDSESSQFRFYGANRTVAPVSLHSSESEESITSSENYVPALEIDPTDEELFQQARRLKYGDYNYPVITVRESIHYVPIIDQQKAHGVRTNLEEEYETFAGPSESDFDEFETQERNEHDTD